MEESNMILIQNFIRMKYRKVLASYYIKKYIRAKFKEVLANKRINDINQSRLAEDATLDCTEFTITNDSIIERRMCEMSMNSSMMNDLQRLEDFQILGTRKDDTYQPKRILRSHKINVNRESRTNEERTTQNPLQQAKDQILVSKLIEEIRIKSNATKIQRHYRKHLSSTHGQTSNPIYIAKLNRIQSTVKVFLNKIKIQKIRNLNLIKKIQRCLKNLILDKKKNAKLHKIIINNKAAIIQRNFRELLSVRHLDDIYSEKSVYLFQSDFRIQLDKGFSQNQEEKFNQADDNQVNEFSYNNDLTLRAKQAEYDDFNENGEEYTLNAQTFDLFTSVDGLADPILEIDCQPDENFNNDLESYNYEKTPHLHHKHYDSIYALRSIEHDSIDNDLKKSDDSKPKKSDLELHIKKIEELKKINCKCNCEAKESSSIISKGLRQMKSHGNLKNCLDSMHFPKSKHSFNSENKHSIVRKLDFKESAITKKVQTRKSMNSMDLLKLDSSKLIGSSSSSILKQKQKSPLTQSSLNYKRALNKEKIVVSKLEKFEDIRAMNSKMSHVTNRSLTQTQLEVINEHCGNSSMRRLNTKALYIPLVTNVIKEEKNHDYSSLSSGASVINLKKSSKLFETKHKYSTTLNAICSPTNRNGIAKSRKIDSLTDRNNNNSKSLQKSHSINKIPKNSGVSGCLNSMQSVMSITCRTSRSREPINQSSSKANVNQTSNEKSKLGFNTSQKLNRTITFEKEGINKILDQEKRTISKKQGTTERNNSGLKLCKVQNQVSRTSLPFTEAKDHKLIRNSTTLNIGFVNKNQSKTKAPSKAQITTLKSTKILSKHQTETNIKRSNTMKGQTQIKFDQTTHIAKKQKIEKILEINSKLNQRFLIAQAFAFWKQSY